jgi:hypothetical protein
MRSRRPVTPAPCAANVSLRLATRSSLWVSPQTSSTTAPTASQASASAEVRSASSTSQARTVTRRRGSSPSSTSPPIDRRPTSRSEKSCRTQISGRRGVTRRASPAIKPVAAALCRPPSQNTSWIAPSASPPCSIASASPWPSAARAGETVPLCASMRSILPRKLASALMRALVMASLPSREVWPPPALVQDNRELAYMFMICSNIMLTTPAESIAIATGSIHKRNQGDSRDGSIAQTGNSGGRGQV